MTAARRRDHLGGTRGPVRKLPLGDPPLLLLLATLATLPMARPTLPAVGATPVQVTDILLGATYVAFVARWVRGRVSAAPDGLLAAGAALVAALATSLVRAHGATVPAVLKLVAFSAYVLLPWLAAQILTDEDGLGWAVRAWLVGLVAALVVALGGIVAFAADRDVLTSLGCSYGRLPVGPYPRVCLPFRNPNLLANYLTVSVAILIASGRLLLPRRAHAGVIAACAVVALFTLSTGIGGFALAGGLTWLAIRRQTGERPTFRAAVLAGAVLVAVAFAVATVGHAVPAGRGHVPLGDSEWHFLKGPRVHTWLSAAATVGGHPLTGAGYGSLVARTPGRDLSEWLRGDLAQPLREEGFPRFAEAHNVWLSVAGQSGLLGLAAFLVFLAVVVRRMSLAPLAVAGPLAHLPAAVVAATIGALAFHGLFVAGEEARHLWGLFGLVAASASLRRTLQRRKALSPGTRTASSARRRP